MPDVSRRRLLQFLGMSPAIPLISKIPVTEPVPMPEVPSQVPIFNQTIQCSGVPGTFTQSGGMCAPQTPLYDLPLPLPANSASRGRTGYSR